MNVGTDKGECLYIPGNYLNLLLEGPELPSPKRLYSEKDLSLAFESACDKLRKNEDWNARMQVGEQKGESIISIPLGP